MVGLLFLGLVIAAFGALSVAALRWGVDSRTGFEDGRRPAGILSAR